MARRLDVLNVGDFDDPAVRIDDDVVAFDVDGFLCFNSKNDIFRNLNINRFLCYEITFS